MSKIIFVNDEKLKRAKDIVELVSGKKKPSVQDEAAVERKETFTNRLSEAGISPSSEEALEFVYKTLGGLVRTEEEQKEFVAKVEASKKRKIAR